MGRVPIWLGLVGLAVVDADAGPPPKAQITIWASAIGGAGYATPGTTGALISEQRDVEVASSGDVRLANVAGTADPATVQLRDLTDPTATITEQRLAPAAKTPTEILARRIGESIVVVTPKGEVTGTLRAVDRDAIVVETGSGDARRVSVLRRDYALDIRMPGAVRDTPGLLWHVATTRPGRHAIELTYRADGFNWSADYRAVLDEPGKLIDFSAFATITNPSGATFDAADLTLIAPASGSKTPPRFALPRPLRLGPDAVQVELFPPRVGAKARPVVMFEAMPDPSAEAHDAPNLECSQNTGSDAIARSELALELDVPAQQLPEGKVRLFRRRGQRLEVIGEPQLRSAPNVARIPLAGDAEITGERDAPICTPDERAHILREKIEVKVENKSAQPADVVVREFLWRWPVWRIESEDHKGTRVGPQTQEYRLRVPAKGTQTVSYTAVYSW